MLHVFNMQHMVNKVAGKPDNLFICTVNGTAKNVVYSQVLQTYIYIYIYSKVGHRDTTTMARN